MKFNPLPVRRIAVIAAGVIAGGALAVSVAPSALATSTAPWQPESGALNAGSLTFYDASGAVVRSGSINDAPFATYVQGSAAGRAGDTKATLYATTPVSGSAPDKWSSEQLSLSTAYPNASAPAALAGSSLPLVSLTASNETLAQYIAHYPNNDASTTDGYGGIYELRLKTSGPGQGSNTVWESADIQVNGTTWTQVYPVQSVPSTTTATVPAAATYGRSYAVPVTVSSSLAPSGSVVAKSGSTVLGSATLGTPTSTGTGYKATATITIPGTKLAPGHQPITVSYAGSSPVLPSAAATGYVTIAKAASTTVARLSALRVSHTARARITVTVSAVGVTPSGTIAIYSGTRRIGTGTLRNGRVVITLPALRKGRYVLTARYLGSGTVKASTSRAVVLTSV